MHTNERCISVTASHSNLHARFTVKNAYCESAAVGCSPRIKSVPVWRMKASQGRHKKHFQDSVRVKVRVSLTYLSVGKNILHNVKQAYLIGVGRPLGSLRLPTAAILLWRRRDCIALESSVRIVYLRYMNRYKYIPR